MIISIIVAMSLDHGIGKDKQLPWHISSDLRRFKKLTMGHYIIMGRKTFESIPRQLPGRKMLILSKRADYKSESGIVLNSIDDAVRYAEEQGESEVFIIGGGEIFEQSIIFADRMYLSIIHSYIDADVFFPQYSAEDWNILHQEIIDLRNGDQYSYTYEILERKRSLLS